MLVIKYILLGIHNVGGATIIVAACAALSYLLFGGLFGGLFSSPVCPVDARLGVRDSQYPDD